MSVAIVTKYIALSNEATFNTATLCPDTAFACINLPLISLISTSVIAAVGDAIGHIVVKYLKVIFGG